MCTPSLRAMRFERVAEAKGSAPSPPSRWRRFAAAGRQCGLCTRARPRVAGSIVLQSPDTSIPLFFLMFRPKAPRSNFNFHALPCHAPPSRCRQLAPWPHAKKHGVTPTALANIQNILNNTPPFKNNSLGVLSYEPSRTDRSTGSKHRQHQG